MYYMNKVNVFNNLLPNLAFLKYLYLDDLKKARQYKSQV